MKAIDLGLDVRLVLFVQATMYAWIGHTHGSGLELYLFKYAHLSYKTVFTLDHNLATVIAALGLLTLWRPYRLVLWALSLIYTILALLSSRYGGFVDDPLPWLGQATSAALPVIMVALTGEAISNRIGHIALFLTLAYTIGLFLNSPPYFLDPIISMAGLTEERAKGLLMGLALIMAVLYFLKSKHPIQPAILQFFALGLAFLSYRTTGLAPEAVLKLALIPALWVLWSIEVKNSDGAQSRS